MSDYYEKLQISNTATELEIKKAFRKLSLEFHPDRNQSPDAQSKFQEINEAYETLSDPNKRRQYDMMGGSHDGGNFPFPGGFPGGFHFGGGHGGMPPEMNDIFEHLFSGSFGGGPGHGSFRVFQNGRPVPQKPPPVQKHIQITLEQAYNGFSIVFEMESPHGKEQIPITVPRGISNNECIVIEEKGHMSGAMRGDIHLIFGIEPHLFFKQDGQDLLCTKTITLKEALCGFLLEIPHLNGKMLRISNQTQPHIVKPGFKREVPGFGMVRGDNTGKLILEFGVVFPDTLTNEQKTVLTETL